nr:hypothetical protein [Pedobacter panaciterrae]
MTNTLEMMDVLDMKGRDNAEVFVQLENVERKQLKADENFDKIFNALQSQELKPKQGIFYDGQIRYR